MHTPLSTLVYSQTRLPGRGGTPRHCVRIPPRGKTANMLFFTLNREDFSFVIHLDRQPRTSRRREAQTGSKARSGSRSERTLDAVEHSRTLMEWWPFLIFHRGGLRIKVINNTPGLLRPTWSVTPAGATSCVASENITPPSSLLRAHAPDQIPPAVSSFRLDDGSLQVVASPCW